MNERGLEGREGGKEGRKGLGWEGGRKGGEQGGREGWSKITAVSRHYSDIQQTSNSAILDSSLVI